MLFRSRIPVELIHRGGGPGSARRAPGGQVSWVLPPGRACVCRAGRGDEGEDPLPIPHLAPQRGATRCSWGAGAVACSSAAVTPGRRPGTVGTPRPAGRALLPPGLSAPLSGVPGQKLSAEIFSLEFTPGSHAAQVAPVGKAGLCLATRRAGLLRSARGSHAERQAPLDGRCAPPPLLDKQPLQLQTPGAATAAGPSTGRPGSGTWLQSLAHEAWRALGGECGPSGCPEQGRPRAPPAEQQPGPPQTPTLSTGPRV